jgi:hypothetical protein
MQRELKTANMEYTLFYWTKICNLQNWKDKNKASQKIRPYIRSKFHVSHLPSPILKYLHTPFINKQKIGHLCRRLTNEVLPADTSALLNQTLRLIPTKNSNIADILVSEPHVRQQSIFQRPQRYAETLLHRWQLQLQLYSSPFKP